MKKGIIIFAVIALAIGAALFCLIPRNDPWQGTVRCYNTAGADFSLPEDTRLDEVLDYVDIECDFAVSHSLVYTMVRGTLGINGRKYDISGKSGDAPISVRGTLATFHMGSRVEDMLNDVYISPNFKYMMLWYGENPEERFDILIGGCETVGELKEAVENYGMEMGK